MVWIWVIVLGSSLISIVGFARAGSIVFWKAHGVASSETVLDVTRPAALSYVAVGGLLLLLIAHTVFAGPMHNYTTKMAAQLFAPQSYIATVVDTPGKLSKPMKKDH
jgi:multicomponent K+:H+ antiporter subunit D